MEKKTNGNDVGNIVFPSISHPKKRAFLIAFSQMGVITQAAEAAGIDRRTVLHWRNTDPDFEEAFEEAREASVDRLEQEAIKRATKGKSDTLLIFLLKGNRPEKYSEKIQAQIEHSGGINLEISIPDGSDDE